MALPKVFQTQTPSYFPRTSNQAANAQMRVLQNDPPTSDEGCIVLLLRSGMNQAATIKAFAT